MLLLLAMLAIRREPTTDSATGRPSPRVTVPSTTPAGPRAPGGRAPGNVPAQTLDQAVVPLPLLANGPIDVRDAGSHPTADEVIERLFEPDARGGVRDTILDAFHRSGVTVDGITVDVTVIELEDERTAADLLSNVRTGPSELGSPVPLPDMPGAVGLTRTSPEHARTVAQAQRNFVIIVTHTWPEGVTPTTRQPPSSEFPIALATLQGRAFICNAGQISRPPGC